jgi:hypothetical protein
MQDDASGHAHHSQNQKEDRVQHPNFPFESRCVRDDTNRLHLERAEHKFLDQHSHQPELFEQRNGDLLSLAEHKCSARTGTIHIGAQQFLLTQAGASLPGTNAPRLQFHEPIRNQCHAFRAGG